MVLEKVFAEIDNRAKEFIERLRESVRIPSVSADPNYRPDVFRMVDWAEKELSALGVKCQQIKNGEQTLPDGNKLQLPPILFGTLGSDPNKKTVLVYGHLDVQPAEKSDGWNTDPFELEIIDGKMFGRGSTDDKGPVVAWMNAIEVLNALKVEIPVNVKFVLEGMEESGSEGLDEVLRQHKDTFLHDVEATCISDNYWLGKNKPCITYGLRGVSYFLVEVSGPKQDLHSGVFGGSLHEPMNSLVHILSTLSDVHGRIKVDGLSELVAPLSKKEEETYKSIDFSVEDYCKDIGVNKLVSESREQILMNRWRYPSLSLHGVEGAFYGSGSKTVIPSKVVGKFSIRLVPNMEPDVVAGLVVKYMEKEWQKLGSPCSFKVIPTQGGRPWLADFTHPHYQAGVRAIEKVFKVKPDFTREGGSIPVTLTFQELTGQSVLLLPLGACDDMAHSQNEKMNVSNYIKGTKVLAAYLLELATL